jgi:glucose/arabinose dehydrogenase
MLSKLVAPVRRRSLSSSRPLVELLEDRLAPATLPTGFSDTQVVSGLSNPTAMEIAPDGRIFVDEQGGNVRVIKNGTLLSTPFASFTVDSSGERGLLGITFDPNFNSNHYVYVYYTATSPTTHNRVSRLTASTTSDTMVAGSEVDLLDLPTLGATNHNGGALHFGPDGDLYIAVGNNAVNSNSQSLSTTLGKMLRIKPDGSIPTDNPFSSSTTGINKAIWALGLRNPFTFAFQTGTGRMFINDVGENTWEEIDDGIAGSNYGWPNSEGFKQPGDQSTTIGTYRDPLFEYGHGSGNTVGSAIVGGTFYDPTTSTFPASYTGTYFFEDLTNGWIRNFDPTTGTATAFATGLPFGLDDLKVGPDGSLYSLARGNGSNTGTLSQIQYHANSVIIDPGFEAPAQGSGSNAYTYSPSGSAWTFTSGAGLTGNGSGFTSGNPSAPQGSQVAFLQFTGSVSQVVNLAAGSYTVTFSAAQRQNFQASSQQIKVTVDGNIVLTLTPAGTTYAIYATNSFTVTAGSHTIAFVGLNPNGGDNTAFLDQVSVNAFTSPPPLGDAGFESPSVGTGSTAYVSDPSGTPWTFSGTAGISANATNLTSGNSSAPQGSQVAFLQDFGSISQVVTLSSGSYAITFSAVQRQNNQASTQVIKVTEDGNTVATITPSGSSYATYVTSYFTVSAGSHTIAFVGADPDGGDNTAFLDQITIQ